MKEIKYIVGDVREPIGEGRKIIAHVVNDLGKMGSGVALAILKKWPVVKERYINWSKNKESFILLKDMEGGEFKLGNTQFVRVDVENKIVVANMIGQHNIIGMDDTPPIRYDALRSCLKKVGEIAKKYNASVNLPYKAGCDRAGGSWDIVEKIIQEELCDKDVEVIVYDIDNLRGI